jgi:hypothetical protein
MSDLPISYTTKRGFQVDRGDRRKSSILLEYIVEGEPVSTFSLTAAARDANVSVQTMRAYLSAMKQSEIFSYSKDGDTVRIWDVTSRDQRLWLAWPAKRSQRRRRTMKPNQMPRIVPVVTDVKLGTPNEILIAFHKQLGDLIACNDLLEQATAPDPEAGLAKRALAWMREHDLLHVL